MTMTLENDFRKLTAEEIGPDLFRVTELVRMGSNWFPAGPADDWTRQALADYIASGAFE